MPSCGATDLARIGMCYDYIVEQLGTVGSHEQQSVWIRHIRCKRRLVYVEARLGL